MVYSIFYDFKQQATIHLPFDFPFDLLQLHFFFFYFW